MCITYEEGLKLQVIMKVQIENVIFKLKFLYFASVCLLLLEPKVCDGRHFGLFCLTTVSPELKTSFLPQTLHRQMKVISKTESLLSFFEHKVSRCVGEGKRVTGLKNVMSLITFYIQWKLVTKRLLFIYKGWQASNWWYKHSINYMLMILECMKCCYCRCGLLIWYCVPGSS